MPDDHPFTQLEELGYAVFPGFLDRQTTARVRAHMDALLPPILRAEDDPAAGRIRTLRHPIPGAIMAELASRPVLLDLAMRLLRTGPRADLRLLEQVLIRTDPKPPPHGPGGWHVDMPFFPGEHDATPRRTYFHMVHACGRVEPGGGAFMIVPGSHKRTYAATARMSSGEELADFRGNAAAIAGVDVARGVEVPCDEGDLLVFNPMAIHSASGNASSRPRYVYFASFFDASATRLHGELAKTGYRSKFPASLRDGLPVELRGMLD